jgi:radical SAM enzyme (TIGR01210 family)
MCGYINDKAPDNLTSENIMKQFQKGVDQFHERLQNPDEQIIFKIFTSGSFLDPIEIPSEIQIKILSELDKYPGIKEIVVESRPEYITDEKLFAYSNILHNKYFEIGIGLETANDFIRQNIINKGFTWDAFIRAKDLLHKYHFGVKAYLLFKPPFLTEYCAMLDLQESLRKCIDVHVDSISINPTNIQQHTICDELNQHRCFRPPWFFSLIYILKATLTSSDLSVTRILCDPSAAGKDRGIHNCFNKESNDPYIQSLKEFILTQDISKLIIDQNDSCWFEYQIKSLLDTF